MDDCVIPSRHCIVHSRCLLFLFNEILAAVRLLQPAAPVWHKCSQEIKLYCITYVGSADANHPIHAWCNATIQNARMHYSSVIHFALWAQRRQWSAHENKCVAAAETDPAGFQQYKLQITPLLELWYPKRSISNNKTKKTQNKARKNVANLGKRIS